MARIALCQVLWLLKHSVPAWAFDGTTGEQ